MSIAPDASDRHDGALLKSWDGKSQHEGPGELFREGVRSPGGGRRTFGKREAILSLPPLDDDEAEAMSTVQSKAANVTLNAHGVSLVADVGKSEISLPASIEQSRVDEGVAGGGTSRRSRRAEILQKPLSSDSDT
jgi:hypothetical protein